MIAKARLRRGAFFGALVALLAAHLLLVRYFFGDALPLPEQAFNLGDFSTHAAQVRRVLEGFEQAGEHWVYDVQLLAGAPNGVLFDADNKGWELWVWALVQLGVGEGRAYNSFVLALHLLMPLVVYASARLFRLDPWAALTTTALAVLLWFFDSFTHWMWYVGTVSYVFVAYFALLPLALFHRWIEDHRPIFALGCAAALALAHLVHPYIFFILVVPMLGVYVRATRERALSASGHAITLAIAAVVVLANAWWLRTALRFFHYILNSAYYEQSGLRFLFYDLFNILSESDTQGMIGVRTSVRLLLVIMAVLCLRSWRAGCDRRRLPFLLLIASMATFAYLGGYTPVAQLQPYRHALPLGFALLIPAGAWLRATLAARPWQGLSKLQRTFALILIVFTGQLLIRDALYFFGPSFPKYQKLLSGREIPMDSLGHAYTPGYRYEGQNDWEELIAWVEARDRKDGARGRWLVQDETLGEYLMARTKAQVLGGFVFRNIEHSDANWFRTAGAAPPYSRTQLRRYFETYAVRWVIVQRQGMNPWWDEYPQLLTRAGFADGMIIYQVHAKSSLLSGPGTVTASVNRLELEGTDPKQDLVVRYHWMETLRCSPDCEIEREPVAGDRVGFMRVPAPHPADFVIENSYEW